MDLAFINKKRLPQFVPFNKINEKVARKCDKIGDNKLDNLGNSKLILEEANMIVNKSNLKIDTLSTDGKFNDEF